MPVITLVWCVAAMGQAPPSEAARRGRRAPGTGWPQGMEGEGETVLVGRQSDNTFVRLQPSTDRGSARGDRRGRRDHNRGSTKGSTKRAQQRAQSRKRSRRRGQQASHSPTASKDAQLMDGSTGPAALFRHRPDVIRVETRYGTRYRMVAQLKPERLRAPAVQQRRCDLPHVTPQRVRVHIIGACNRARDVHLHRAATNWCGVDGFNCSVYLDGNCHNELHERLLDVQGASSPGQWLLNLVTPLQYLPARDYPPTHECCNESVRFSYGSPRRSSSSLGTWDGMGPSTYFCGAHNHRKETRQHQMRFLYALAHERRVHWHSFQSRHLDWLVQLDDDSAVSLPRLLQVLTAWSPNSTIR